jgi:hypothetical protein
MIEEKLKKLKPAKIIAKKTAVMKKNYSQERLHMLQDRN